MPYKHVMKHKTFSKAKPQVNEIGKGIRSRNAGRALANVTFTFYKGKFNYIWKIANFI